MRILEPVRVEASGARVVGRLEATPRRQSRLLRVVSAMFRWYEPHPDAREVR